MWQSIRFPYFLSNWWQDGRKGGGLTGTDGTKLGLCCCRSEHPGGSRPGWLIECDETVTKQSRDRQEMEGEGRERGGGGGRDVGWPRAKGRLRGMNLGTCEGWSGGNWRGWMESILDRLRMCCMWVSECICVCVAEALGSCWSMGRLGDGRVERERERGKGIVKWTCQEIETLALQAG